jgi:4-hydroxy-4-methyl-2-oxoglutarate aldolase
VATLLLLIVLGIAVKQREERDMQTVKDMIVQTIRRNLISTSQVSDCLGKTGEIKQVFSLNPGNFRAGPVRFVYAYNCSNWELHEQLEEVQAGEVVIVEAIDCEDYAVFGALVSKFTLLYRGVSAMVVNGLVRDINDLRKESYPIWCRGITPVGCFNRKNDSPPDLERIEKLRTRYEGTIAVCDDSGVVVIPRTKIAEDFLEKLRLMELQEDAWFHSIDTDGFTTYETVCLRQYLAQGSVFSKYNELKEGVGSA